MKTLTLGLFIYLGSLTLALNAGASDTNCDQASQSSTDDAVAIRNMVQQYLLTYSTFERTDDPEFQNAADVCAKFIAEKTLGTFKSLKPTLYIDTLKRIDGLYSLSPGAIFDLEYRIQLLWQHRHLKDYFLNLTELNQSSQLPAEDAVELTAMALQGLTTVAHTQLGLFSTFETLTAALVGVYGLGTLTQQDLASLGVPLPPAEVFKHSIALQQLAFVSAQKKQFLNHATALTVGATASVVATRTVGARLATLAPTLLGKVVVAGLAVGAGMITQNWVTASAENGVSQIQIALQEKKLTESAHALEEILRHPLPGPETPAAKRRLAHILTQAKKVAHRAFELVATRDPQLADPKAQSTISERMSVYVAAHLARNELASLGIDPEDINIRDKLEAYFAALPEVKEQAIQEIKFYLRRKGEVAHGPDAFRSFLKLRADRQNNALVRLATQGQWLSDNDALFLQLAAYFKSFDEPYLNIYSRLFESGVDHAVISVAVK